MGTKTNVFRLMRGDEIVLNGMVYTVGNVQQYWNGDVRMNLTDCNGWTYNHVLNGTVELFREKKGL